MDRKELLIAYTKRLWMANTANDITGLLLDYEKDLKLIEEREQVKNCSIPAVVGQSEQLPRKSKYCVSISPEPCKYKGVCEICSK